MTNHALSGEPRISAVATAVPAQDVVDTYRRWARRQIPGEREGAIFERMAERSGIAHRWSIFDEADARLEPGSFHAREKPPAQPSGWSFARGPRPSSPCPRSASCPTCRASPTWWWPAAPASSHQVSTRSSPASSISAAMSSAR
ncbi:hypothetical protein QQS45_10305 [Alteriqipengyuania flavescens]|nr:hypothetical protein [Alteriqipengyuania flavescens]WJY18016.1 hypothetical protein QQW98_10300 [Alteriqipengyuania flavescens]WJY23957.1 hypothetical protein QQS45_10305 [Alteriqipengyuania flavescens]